MRVRHVMSVNPVTCEVTDPCVKAARLMRDRGVGFVVCLQNGRVAGILTDRDLAVHCLADGFDGEKVECQKIMTAHPALVAPDETIFAAMDTMRSAGMVRRVPVVDDSGALVGVVSLSDLAVVAKDILDAILDDQLHRSTKEARALTGAKRLAKKIRRPTKADRIPEVAIVRKTRSSREGVVRNPIPSTRRGVSGRQVNRARSQTRAAIRRGPRTGRRRTAVVSH